MRRILRRLWQDERGVSLAIIALMMTTLLSMLAFSLDLGLLYTARAEAQRAADAAALAGASAFLNYGANANQRAVRYATLNEIRNEAIRPDEVGVTVYANDSVHVRVRRQSVPLFFAGLFGITTSPVTASATAGTVPANIADCVVPLAFDFDWDWAQQGDAVTIAPEDGAAADYEYVTLDFLPKWEDANFGGCPSDPISLDPPESVGLGPPPLRNWAWELFQKDQAASWHQEAGIMSEHGWNSPRIVTIMLYEPLSDQMVAAKDFLLFFIESASPDSELVQGRFLAYASGSGEGPSQTMLAIQLTR